MREIRGGGNAARGVGQADRGEQGLTHSVIMGLLACAPYSSDGAEVLPSER